MDAVARFRELVRGPEDQIGLDEGALLLAAAFRPGLDLPAQRARLDDLAAGCPEPSLAGIRFHLFSRLGLAGDRDSYYDPRNSFLDQVLDRRRGIPITLAVVMMEVGRRLGVPFSGIGLPGHFLVRHDGDPPLFLDPFDEGRALDLEDCKAIFRAVHGDDVAFDPGLLVPVGPHAILARILANLIHIYRAGGAAGHLATALRLRAAVPGLPVQERGELAGVLASVGQFGEAAALLDDLATKTATPEAEGLRSRALLLRARLN